MSEHPNRMVNTYWKCARLKLAIPLPLVGRIKIKSLGIMRLEMYFKKSESKCTFSFGNARFSTDALPQLIAIKRTRKQEIF